LVEQLVSALGPGATVTRPAPGEVEVGGMLASEVGDLAHAHGIPLHHLAEVEQSLEDAYLSLTEGEVEHQGQVPGALPEGASA
jgi:ABC-2 type transport system ATP-binding protein